MLLRLATRSPRASKREAAPSVIRIVDVINLASSAKEMLLNRLRILHRPPVVENWIVCSSGSHVRLLRAAGIPVTVINTTRGLEPTKLGRATVQLAQFFRRSKPDIVHTHCSIPGLVGRIAARLAGVPVVMHTVHGFHFHECSSRASRTIYSAAERTLAAISDALLTENHEDLHVIKRWGRPRVHAQMVGNGIDIDRYAQFARHHTEPGRIVTCIARFDPIKNHRDLLHVFARVHAQLSHARLRLIGDGALRPQCEQLAADLGIAGVTDFLGYREDVERLLADTDVAVLLSWKEGMSRALLEPMAAGIPAVAWRVKGNRELIRSSQTGLLAAVGDLDETAAYIVHLLSDFGLRARLGAAAAESVRNSFDEIRVAERLRRVYGSLLENAGYVLPPQWHPVLRKETCARTVLSA